jgi:2-iminobutanoate/2-iminopropanoate deaminase
MEKQIISTEQAPAAVGPYSQGVRAGHFLYTAGQIALDPATGKIVEGDVAAQTRQVMGNLQAILQAAGSTLDKVVKTTVFLQEMDDFAQMNGEYSQFFEGDPPARSTVQVAGLPLGALVEIEAIALIPHQ